MRFKVDGIETAPDRDSLLREILNVLNPVGVEQVIYLSTDPARSNTDLLTTLPGLHADQAGVFDPFLDYCCDAYDPTWTGAAFLDDHPYLEPQDIAFIRRAADEFGWITGVGIPVRLRGSERYGGFNYGTGLDRQTFLSRFEPLLPELRIFSLLVHRRLEELHQTVSVPAPGSGTGFRDLLVSQTTTEPSLTPRETEVLFLMTRGCSTKEIARLCTISPNTAAEYRKSLYRKLGVRNAAAAVAKAAEIGLG